MSRHFLVAVFTRADDLLEAIREARQVGFVVDDAYVPYAVHGLDEALGLRRSWIGWVTFAFGGLACLAAVAFQGWVAAVDWPVDIGGKPFFFWQIFIPVAFEFTILCGGLATVAALLVSQGLLPGRRPRLSGLGMTDDRFVMSVLRTDTAFDEERMRELCRRHHAVETRAHIEEAM